VSVVQGNLTIRCDRLVAFYPADTNQPDRLTCHGNVRLQQGDQKARCEEAVYDRSGDRLTCQGNAVFEEGGNELHGALIEIDLAAETMHVTGGARVLIRSNEKRRKPRQEGEG
jgi:lipopolysaccharide transport protein LptA